MRNRENVNLIDKSYSLMKDNDVEISIIKYVYENTNEIAYEAKLLEMGNKSDSYTVTQLDTKFDIINDCLVSMKSRFLDSIFCYNYKDRKIDIRIEGDSIDILYNHRDNVYLSVKRNDVYYLLELMFDPEYRYYTASDMIPISSYPIGLEVINGSPVLYHTRDTKEYLDDITIEF